MKKPKVGATITVNWGYENHSITLTPRNWAAIKAGHSHAQRGSGYLYDAEFFWDYWKFDGGIDGELEVTYGSDGGCGFSGALSEARIEEHEYKPKRRFNAQMIPPQ